MTCHFRLPLAESCLSAGSASLLPTSRDLERNAMVRSIPTLRGFAKSLTGNADQADDLVQEALVRGIAKIESFQPGTTWKLG
jgi:DNA-directed RNA polymerase specialized sigma24 family protein